MTNTQVLKLVELKHVTLELIGRVNPEDEFKALKLHRQVVGTLNQVKQQAKLEAGRL